MKKPGVKASRFRHGAAIYARIQTFLSRPIIGHTPRKFRFPLSKTPEPGPKEAPLTAGPGHGILPLNKPEGVEM